MSSYDGGDGYAGKVVIAYKYNTTTTVACGTGSVAYGTAVACMATVTRGGTTGTPTGTITWSHTDSGNFDSGTCALSGAGASASCSVNYTPASIGDGTHRITANYGGDGDFNISNGFQDVTVSPKALTITGLTANNKTYDGGVTEPSPARPC